MDWIEESIEKLVEDLLIKSAQVLDEEDNLKAWVLVDVETDKVSKEIMDFRKEISEICEETDTLRFLWDKELLQLQSEEAALWKTLFSSTEILFEAALVREELEDKGIDISSVHKFAEIKIPILKELGVWSLLKERGILSYKPNFRFLIDGKIVDLFDIYRIRSFYSKLQDPIIKKWIRWNLKKDGSETWFDDIPWTSLGFYRKEEDEDFVFVEGDEPRHLLCFKEPNISELEFHWHLRYYLHLLKRFPIDIGAKMFFNEIPLISDYLFLKTYENARDELKISTLPTDLRNYLESTLQRWESFGTHKRPGVYMLKPIYELMLNEKPKNNPIVDRFLEDRFRIWKDQGKPRGCRKTYIISDQLKIIKKKFFNLVNRGTEPKEALQKAVDEILNIYVSFLKEKSKKK